MIELLLLLTMPFLFIGIINKPKATFVGKKGACIFQPYFDFIKLMKKGEVLSTTTSFIFEIAPCINLSCIILSALIISIFHFKGDFILFAYILALGKFFNVIASLDTGSSFEGMGASREVSYTSFVEPAFFIILASICALKGMNSFDSLNALFGNGYILISCLIAFVFFMMILIEGSRTPIDDPKTHLELTMIHEVMILDNSGIDLALFSWANGIKMLLISSLISYIVLPQNIGTIESILSYLAIMLVISFLIGTIESAIARLRMSHVFEFVFIMSSFALVVLSLVVARMFGG